MNKLLLKKLDKLGAILSFTCALHCLMQPFLLLLLPFIGLGFFTNPIVENVFISGTVILAFVALFLGFNHHGEKKTFILLGIGISLIVLSRIVEPEPLFAVSGALFIAFAHIWNLTLRTHSDDDGHNHEHIVVEKLNSDLPSQTLTLN